MPLEVVEGDDDVGIHDGAANLGGFTEGTAHHRHLHIVGALQAVGNEDLAARGIGAEAVEERRVQVIQGVLPGAHVEGVAVGEEGVAAQLLDIVGHVPGEVGAQEGQVAQLAEVDLDGHILPLEVNLIHARGLHELAELRLVVLAVLHAEIGKIHGSTFHESVLLIVLNGNSILLLYRLSPPVSNGWGEKKSVDIPPRLWYNNKESRL